ncbi:hypothetical protein CL176_06860 [Suicoccus acidiformans]|uniref:Uncharacterized protein n=2 Tax=Suicoccus acidiformans TaxID=2036206 RepID=A0A347WKY4_9LACT|nr:hypothetical protein CL176_06860 [Suicoccus acidiformans]
MLHTTLNTSLKVDDTVTNILYMIAFYDELLNESTLPIDLVIYHDPKTYFIDSLTLTMNNDYLANSYLGDMLMYYSYADEPIALHVQFDNFNSAPEVDPEQGKEYAKFYRQPCQDPTTFPVTIKARPLI